MNIQSSYSHRPQALNPVTREVSKRAGVSNQKFLDRVDWIVDKYNVQNADDYPAAVQSHNKRGLLLMGGLLAGIGTAAICGTGYLTGLTGKWSLWATAGGAALTGYTSSALERNYEHKSFGKVPFFG